MLNWLDKYWQAIRGTVGGAASDAIHWSEHAIMGAVHAVFSVVTAAWGRFYSEFHNVYEGVNFFMAKVRDFATYVLHVVIPNLSRWVSAWIASLRRGLADLGSLLQRTAVLLTAKIVKAYQDALSWTVAHVWAPLWAIAQKLRADLQKWGYTAWWYITHPAALADLLILYLATSAEKQAWALARTLGTFGLALVVRNLPRFLRLAEDIITAVL